jgi:ketosteroid isomerase-like protein
MTHFAAVPALPATLASPPDRPRARRVAHLSRALPFVLAAAPALLVAAALAAAANGQAAAAGAGAERERLAATDRAFAALSRREGMRAAFLAYLAADAVLFRPGPVPGRAFIEERPSPAIELTWEPVFSAVATSGDLGYTTGPYAVHDTGPDHHLSEQGYYVTIWRKQADGTWKVELDQGVTTPSLDAGDAAAIHDRASPAADAGDQGTAASGGSAGAAAGSAPAAPAPAPEAAAAPTAAPGATGAAREALLDADRDFAGDAGAHGARPAYMARLAPEARLYRNGAAPAVGREAIAKALAAGPQTASSWQATTAAASAAGDLGYTYGNSALMAPLAPNRIKRLAVYVRIWQRQRDAKYRIVLDLVKMLPENAPGL